MTTPHPIRVAVLQSHVPHYRLPYFDAIAAHDRMALHVHAEHVKPRSDGSRPDWFRPLGPMRNLARGLNWQPGAASLDLSGVDVLVLSATIRTVSNFPLALRARAKGIPVIWWGHYHSAGSRENARRLRRAMYSLGKAVLFYTDEEVALYRADGGQLPASALNNGIDTREITTLRTPYEAETRPKRALFLGRVTEKSRFDLLLQAMARPECATFELSVIGDADDAIRNRAQQLGCAERILWHGPQFSEADIAPIANDCRCFVYPGAVGLSIIHAMAYGLPALVHDQRADHMPEIAAFSDGETGQSFAHGDVADLAARLSAMMINPNRLHDQSATALSMVADRFNTEAMAARFVAWVQQCVNTHTKNRIGGAA